MIPKWADKNNDIEELAYGIETIHVLPVDDLKPHIESQACKCQPRVDTFKNGNRVITHNSFDGREFYEDEGDIQLEGFGKATYV